MKKYTIKQNDLIKARNLIIKLRKLLKERNLTMINHGLLELNDIFLNVSEEK
jgi:hypothetical protein